jgi:hypothetical protein
MSRVENVDCSPTKTSAPLSFVLSGIVVEDVDIADPILADGQQLLVGTDWSSRKLAGALSGTGEKVRPFIGHLSSFLLKKALDRTLRIAPCGKYMNPEPQFAVGTGTDPQRYGALFRISEALSPCEESEELARVLADPHNHWGNRPRTSLTRQTWSKHGRIFGIVLLPLSHKKTVGSDLRPFTKHLHTSR